MPKIVCKDIAKVYPFIEVNGIFNRKKKQEALNRQKAMPYTSNEGVVALQHFSCEIEDGEFVAVLGHSGSGKSTLLRIIAGLEKASVGDIYFDEERMNDVKPEDRDVAMVFQNYSLYPNLTIYDNIAFPLKAMHLPREELEEKVDYIVDLLNLRSKLKRMPEELSGGEQQRVAIARALVRKPKVFLLDEPFSNLDVMMRNSLRNELKKLQKTLGITFIYVTHDQSDALLLADRLIVLKDGVTLQDASVEEVYNRPANKYVAGFIGSPTMNFFAGIKLDKKNNDCTYTLFDKTYRLSGKEKNAVKNSSTVSVGIRAVNIAIAETGVEAVIDYTELIGADIILHCHIQKQEVTVVKKVITPRDTEFFHNQTIYLTFDEEYFHLYDDKEQRIN